MRETNHGSETAAEAGHAMSRLRMLVVIASYGHKNAALLQRAIENYRAMPYAVDIVVVSNEPKPLDAPVEVVVGLPSADPWSLPFAHQPIFVDRADEYDLFLYAEDDMLIRAGSIDAFTRASASLPPECIAGFLRFETDDQHQVSLPDIHGNFRWDPRSVCRHGDELFAHFTNEHAALYLLTKDQLKRMIAKDGFVHRPHAGRYDMLCTAATLPYTTYGLTKLVCLSHIDDFLVHHMSNRYVGQMGVGRQELQAQIDAMHRIGEDGRVPDDLFGQAQSWPTSSMIAKLYEDTSAVISGALPHHARSLLSVGCGNGATEAQLIQRGIAVTAFPVDAIMAAVAGRRGIDVLSGSFEACCAQLGERKFDCVLLPQILHLLPDPLGIVEHCVKFVAPGGVIVISGRNFDSLRMRIRRALRKGEASGLHAFSAGGINVFGPAQVRAQFRALAMKTAKTYWLSPRPASGLEGKLGRWGSTDWVVCGRP